jgi:hypothetical protein
VCSTTTRQWDFGDHGIGAIIYGSLGKSYVTVRDERFTIRKHIYRADVRYLYIPVGGSKNVAAATLLVFTFVALWHDLSFRLLAWGWLVSLFVLPEIAARAIIPFEKVSQVTL